MKTKILLFVLLFPAFILMNSCQEDELLSTSFSVVLTQDFIVSNTADSVFVKDTLLDASAQSGDIEKYKDRIQQVSLTRVSYLLTAFNGADDQELSQGNIVISDTGGTNSMLLTTLSQVNLKALWNNETDLTVNQPAVELLGNLVKDAPHAFRVHAEGVMNKKPLDFTIRIRFHLTIKAGVL